MDTSTKEWLQVVMTDSTAKVSKVVTPTKATALKDAARRPTTMSRIMRRTSQVRGEETQEQVRRFIIGTQILQLLQILQLSLSLYLSLSLSLSLSSSFFVCLPNPLCLGLCVCHCVSLPSLGASIYVQ